MKAEKGMLHGVNIGITSILLEPLSFSMSGIVAWKMILLDFYRCSVRYCNV